MAVDDLVEYRGKAPKGVLAVVDAFAIAKRTDRTAIINRILLGWAKEQIHLSTVVANTTRGNPPLPESDWGALE